MGRCCFGNLAAFQWKCAAAPAQRQFGVSAVFFADMLVSMQKPRASKRKIKSAEALPKNLCTDSVLFGQLPLAFFSSIGLSMLARDQNLIIRVFVKSGRQMFRMFKSGWHSHKW